MCTFSYILEQSGLTRSEFARVLDIPPSAINARIKGKNDIKISELEKVEEYVGRKLYRGSDVDFSEKAVHIQWLKIDGIPQQNFIGRVVDEVYFDTQISLKEWNYKLENLRAIKMLGDKMAGGEYPLRNEDTLLVDITQKDPLSPGIYVFSTRGKNIFICGVTRLMDGSTKFYFNNKNYEPKILTEEDIQESNLTIIGRVIKNLSLRI